MDREDMIDDLTKKAYAVIEKEDLSEGEPLLQSDYGLTSSLRLDATQVWHRDDTRTNSAMSTIDEWSPRHSTNARSKAYNEKEIEYPVLAGISKFTTKEGAQVTLDREETCRMDSASLRSESVRRRRSNEPG